LRHYSNFGREEKIEGQGRKKKVGEKEIAGNPHGIHKQKGGGGKSTGYKKRGGGYLIE